MRAPLDLDSVEGEANLTAAMRTLRFPTSRDEAVARVGGWPLLDDGESRVTLGDILAGMSESTFHDRARAAKEADRRFTSVVRALASVDRARPPR